ncbi:MAG: KOW domain-containing RNA-binding protein [Monoglobales bacterium]
MEYAQGTVVVSLKGHDKGKLFVIIKSEEPYVYLVDGKNRKKHNPKKKSMKHIKVLQHYMPEVESLSDKAIRKQLNRMIDS